MSTIAAISTAMGNGGIGIIRMSGDNCFDILKKMSVTPLHDPLELEAPTGNIHKDVRNAKETESIIASGASHR